MPELEPASPRTTASNSKFFKQLEPLGALADVEKVAAIFRVGGVGLQRAVDDREGPGVSIGLPPGEVFAVEKFAPARVGGEERGGRDQKRGEKGEEFAHGVRERGKLRSERVARQCSLCRQGGTATPPGGL